MTSRRRHLHLFGALVACALSMPMHADVVLRRGSVGELRGRVSIDDSGVTVRSTSGARQVISWDRVSDVQPDQPLPGLDRYLTIAEDLWRARSRLERGDATLAEPLFAELFARFRGQTHESALVAAEGLLRCCLHRGAQAEAVIPALETIRIRRSGISTASYSNLPPVIDNTTELCIQLPPFWIEDRHLLALDADLNRYDAQRDQVVTRMAQLMHRAVRIHLDVSPPDDSSTEASQHDGLRLLRQMIDAAFGDTAVGNQQRSALQSQLNDQPPAWVRAWSRMAIGIGLTYHRDPIVQDVGLVNLAYLPARFSSAQPFLAGLALFQIRSILSERGDSSAAAAIEDELKRRFPGHPILLQISSTASRPHLTRGTIDHA